METNPYPKPFGKRGAISVLMVLTVGTVALVLSVYTYRRAIQTHEVAGKIQLRSDYREKEDTVLRSIVALLPNRAILGMKQDSISYSNWEPLLWRSIFNDSLDLANTRTSISDDLKNSMGIDNLITANSGDSSLSNSDAVFNPVSSDTAYDTNYGYWLITAGINRELDGNFPPPLEVNDGWVDSLDRYFPIISDAKSYGDLAIGDVGLDTDDYPQFNIIEYPQISFGYARPGEDFLAKRNWWAFSMELAEADDNLTGAAAMRRDFVVSIYEVPSQLAISAASFMSLGEFGTGDDWTNVTISGGVFAGRAEVTGDTQLSSLASRRGMILSSDAAIGGKSFVDNPFAPGLRESYQITEGDFYPVSLSSESGRVAFVPINRGADYFDRFAHTVETNTLSPTTWNNYSVGALQCAMRLDIVDCASSTDPTPTRLRFSYIRNGVREDMDIELNASPAAGLPPGYIFACNEDQIYDFEDSVVDLAYGTNGSYFFESGASGQVAFNNARFGDPAYGFIKQGYYKPSYPWEVRILANGKICLAVFPQRIEAFLDLIDADDTSINHSMVVNVDYTSATGSIHLDRPQIPTTDLDYGLILEECADMTSFTRGFSLVTNLRTYIGDDFNIQSMTPPAGYTPTGDYYPPISFFAPEKRYGIDLEPWQIQVSGQIGSLASENDDMVRPLDSKGAAGTDFIGNRIEVNLNSIPHPAELPPVTMMNWLVTIEEMRPEFDEDN